MDARDHIAALAFLQTLEGEEVLRKAREAPNDPLTRLTRLRKITTPENAAIAVELLELRHRARAKFSCPETLFFTSEGLEQSTSEPVAQYRAIKFPPNASVLDACCGIGGDALALASGRRVLAADLNPVALACLAANRSRESSELLFPLCADVTLLDLSRLRNAGITHALFDPSRRADAREGGRRRVRSADAYSPPLDWLETLRACLPHLAVKVSPAIDDLTLGAYPDAQIEFISSQGECKEATLWFGDLASPHPAVQTADGSPIYTATVLREGEAPHSLSPQETPALSLSEPLAWLYEPDPAVIRAHQTAHLATLLNAFALSPRVAYLTSDTLQATPFATAYRVLEWQPFHLKRLQARLRTLQRRVAVVKKRGVPLEPDVVRKQLAVVPHDAPPLTLVLTPSRDDKTLALLCEPLSF